jgi:hypothetical protein
MNESEYKYIYLLTTINFNIKLYLARPQLTFDQQHIFIFTVFSLSLQTIKNSK